MTNIHYFGLGSISGFIISIILLLILYCDRITDNRKHRFMLNNGFIFRSAATSGYEAFEYYRDYDKYCIPEKYVIDEKFYKLKKRYKVDKKKYKKYLNDMIIVDIQTK